MRASLLCVGGVLAICAPLFGQIDEPLPEGAVVLYAFNEGEGAVLADQVGAEAGDDSMDLSLGDAMDRQAPPPRQGLLGPIVRPGAEGRVEWTEEGLRVDGPRVAASTEGPATRLIEALTESGEWTVEVVVRPADTEQEGPARIVSLSLDPYHRNLTLGQERDRYVVRLRTSETEENGMPDIAAPEGSVRAERQHVVATFAAGMVTIYVDGEPVTSVERGGDLSTWDASYALVLANEADLDRQWNGVFEFVAIYDRALGAGRVGERFTEFFPSEDGNLTTR